MATVPWTTDRLLNTLIRGDETTKWRDPTGTVAVAEADLHEDWVGHRVTTLEDATGARVAFLIRFGTGVLPEPKTVIQAGDQVYLAAVSGDRRGAGDRRGTAGTGRRRGASNETERR